MAGVFDLTLYSHIPGLAQPLPGTTKQPVGLDDLSPGQYLQSLAGYGLGATRQVRRVHAVLLRLR